MTIAVAVRTESAVVFAADSKVTTMGIGGIQDDGTPRWLEQTYDNGTKIASTASGYLMAMVAGPASIGRVAATDFIAAETLKSSGSREEQDQRIAEIVAKMVAAKQAAWSTTKIEPANWPGPTMLLAAPAPAEMSPRIWRVQLAGEGSKITEILQEPFIRFEGSYNEVLTLLYGYDDRVLSAIGQGLGAEPSKVVAAIESMKVLRPIDQINFRAMPIQDAMNFAVLLASVQVEMDRFTPGTPVCGGAIDVMVLRTAPHPSILSYAGKELHHPHRPR